jgi:DNA-binding CsgD family transcriptional regulator
MNDLLFNTRLLGAMQAHACLTEEETIVLNDWAKGKSIANTSMMHHMSESTVNRIRRRLRQKYDGIQGYANLPPRK